MAKIDRKMLSSLETWCRYDTPKETNVLYIAGHDRDITMATIRRLIYEEEKRDPEGEGYISLFSAINFTRHAREYFEDIANLYGVKIKKKDSLGKIIGSIPPTAWWITLIISDVEELSGLPEKLKEIIDTSLEFSLRGARVILISKLEYEELFISCPKLKEFFKAAKEDDGKLPRIECCIQEKQELEDETFEDEKDRRCALQRYLEIIYEQRERGQFDYESYKHILSDVWAYLSPRITGDCVRRDDLLLIELLADFEISEDAEMDGCECWEYEAAGRIARGLNVMLSGEGEGGDISEDGTCYIRVSIRHKGSSYGCISFSGSINTALKTTAATIPEKMDLLSEAIKASAYDGDNIKTMQLAHLFIDDELKEEKEKEIEHIEDVMSSLTEKIKEISLETVNKGMK